MRFSLALVTAWMCLPLPASAEDEAAAADPAPIADEPLPATATVCVAAWGGGRTWVSPVAVDIDDAHTESPDSQGRVPVWCLGRRCRSFAIVRMYADVKRCNYADPYP